MMCRQPVSALSPCASSSEICTLDAAGGGCGGAGVPPRGADDLEQLVRAPSLRPATSRLLTPQYQPLRPPRFRGRCAGIISANRGLCSALDPRHTANVIVHDSWANAISHAKKAAKRRRMDCATRWMSPKADPACWLRMQAP